MDGHINHPDNDTLRFAVDMDLYTTTHSRLLGFMGDAERLREDYGFSKTELRTGDVALRKLKDLKAEGGGYYFDGIFHPEMRNETPEDSR